MPLIKIKYWKKNSYLYHSICYSYLFVSIINYSKTGKCFLSIKCIYCIVYLYKYLNEHKKLIYKLKKKQLNQFLMKKLKYIRKYPNVKIFWSVEKKASITCYVWRYSLLIMQSICLRSLYSNNKKCNVGKDDNLSDMFECFVFCV